MVAISLTNPSTSSCTVYAVFEKHANFRTGSAMNLGFIQMLYESHSVLSKAAATPSTISHGGTSHA